MDLLPENQEPLELWHQIKTFGSDLVFTLRDMTLTQFEGEELLHKLSLIETIVNEFEQAEQEE